MKQARQENPKPYMTISSKQSLIGYHLDYLHFLDYHPPIYDHKIEISNPDLEAVLSLDYDDDSLNLANTDKEKVKNLVLSYVKLHPDVLEKFQIQSIEHLSVSDAAKLACQIVVDRMKYDNETNLLEYADDGDGKKFITEDGAVYLSIDTSVILPPEKMRAIWNRLLKTQKMPIEELLSEWHRWVCRHYARAYVAVFDALKSIDEWGQLRNTYVIVTGNLTHAFNTIISVCDNQRIMIAVVDPTSADISELYEGDTIKQTTEHALWIDEFDSTRELVHDANTSFYLALYRAALRRRWGFFSFVDKEYLVWLKKKCAGILENI